VRGNDFKYKDLKCGKFQCCGNTKGGSFRCFGQPNQQKCMAGMVPGDRPSILGIKCDGITGEALVKCYKQAWEPKGYKNLRNIYLARDSETTGISYMGGSVATYCGTVDFKNKEIITCFGDTRPRVDEKQPKQCYGKLIDVPEKKERDCRTCAYPSELHKKFSSTSTDPNRPCFSCGIVKDTKEAYCWGPPSAKEWERAWRDGRRRKAPKNPYIQFRDDPQGKDEKHSFDPDTPVKGVKFSAIAVGSGFACGIIESSQNIQCWGNKDVGCRRGECAVPTDIKFREEPSCKTSHPILMGPASCTSCRPRGCNRHFTIMDPKTNTGTCTKKKCPTCKPKTCCGDGHKHYVLNTKNLEGVCVRHNDDCTPVCVPMGSDDPGVRRVCTKGCNRLLKVMKAHNTEAQTEEEMFDIVACQADKRVICEPTANATAGFQNPCRMSASFKARALCPFSPSLWNLGSTCITNHVRGDKYPQCPKGTKAELIEEVKEKCHVAKKEDNARCSRLAASY